MLNEINSLIAVKDFKSRDDLIEAVRRDKQVVTAVQKIEESFKILFGYIELTDNVLLSYLKDEEGFRYQIERDQSNILIERVQDDLMHSFDNMKVWFKDDFGLSGMEVKIGDSLRKFNEIQLGVANYHIFDEKPQFYPEI